MAVTKRTRRRVEARALRDTRRVSLTIMPFCTSASIDARIAMTLAASHGVASDHRLRSVVSRWAITDRLRAGLLHEVLPRTYALTSADELTALQRGVAAQESLQHHRSLLGFTTAAHALAIWNRGRDGVVHVVSETMWRPSRVPWVDYHSVDELRWDERQEAGGLLVTSVLQTCLDLGRVLDQWQLAHVLWEAEFRYGLDLDELERRNEQRRGRRGCAVVRAALALRRAGSAGTRSASEDYLLAGIIRARLPIPDVCNPNATELSAFEFDLVWRAHRVVVELDGTTGHRRAGRVQRDRSQTEALERAGYVVLRITTEALWADRDAVVARIRAGLVAVEVP